MTKQLRRALVLVPAMVIATSAVALAAGPVKGGTYTGVTAHGKEAISLKVSASGKTVTVHVPSPPAYCVGGGGPAAEIGKAAAISSSGSFKGSIAYEFVPFHKTVVKLFFNGKFSGGKVTGTARSEFPFSKQCNGSTSFSAKTA